MYYDLKFLHIAVVLIFILSQAQLFAKSSKLHNILAGITSLLVLGTGFAMLKRFGISHSGPFPVWVIIKLAVWSLLAIAYPIVFKRFRSLTKLLYIPWILLILMAVAMAIYKF
tara:strand:- start:209 stop:547 length:339 start_codon:yes stop_codon:yes gene_type:complete